MEWPSAEGKRLWMARRNDTVKRMWPAALAVSMSVRCGYSAVWGCHRGRYARKRYARLRLPCQGPCVRCMAHAVHTATSPVIARAGWNGAEGKRLRMARLGDTVKRMWLAAFALAVSVRYGYSAVEGCHRGEYARKRCARLRLPCQGPSVCAGTPHAVHTATSPVA